MTGLSMAGLLIYVWHGAPLFVAIVDSDWLITFSKPFKQSYEHLVPIFFQTS